jgi:hypothetical protein
VKKKLGIIGYVLFTDKTINSKGTEHKWKLHQIQVIKILWGRQMGEGCIWALLVSAMVYFL